MDKAANKHIMGSGDTLRKFKKVREVQAEYGKENPGWGEGGKVRSDKENRDAARPDLTRTEFKNRREQKAKDNKEGRGTHEKVTKGVLGTDADRMEPLMDKKVKRPKTRLKSPKRPSTIKKKG